MKQGRQGIAGIKGLKGDRGSRGNQGNQGEHGVQGRKGAGYTTWKRNIFYIAIITFAIYATIAFVSNSTIQNTRQGCERGNTAREQVYHNSQARIIFDQAIYDAVSQGPNAARVRAAVRADQKQAKEALKDLIYSPGTDTPWATSCEDAYPKPLPWPGR